MPDIPSHPASFLVTLNPDHIATLSDPAVTLQDVAATITSQAGSLRVMADGPADDPVIEMLRVAADDPHTLLVTLSDDDRAALAARYGDAIVIEPDIELDLFDTVFAPSAMSPLNFFAAAEGELVIDVTLTGRDGTPVPRAEVTVQGSQIYGIAQAVTDARGKARLTLYGETPDSLREIKVKPSAGYWGLIIKRPDLTGVPVTRKVAQLALTLTPISLHNGETDVWGYLAMQLDKPTPAAQPVRIAVIDSGLSASHDDLNPAGGHDFTNRGDPANAWRDDLSGHGTHVAGTCAARFDGHGICGAAGPEAQVYGLSVFPGGRASSLISALDWCVTHQIDVVNMSLGSAQGTNALHQAVIRATAAGITLVAAAGNAARPVMFPAASPEAAHIGAHRAGDFFSAAFTCFGPEIDVAGPGVAVISAVPSATNKDYAVMSGTSMASPYVAGFVARLLATRPDLQALPRGQGRVQAVKSALRACCIDIGLPRPYQGHGLPVWGDVAPAEEGLVAQLRAVSDALARALA
jgi:subtilisin